jgi:IS605 OrfB family transposase
VIRSTKTTLKFSNKNKLDNLHLFIEEYRRVVGLFVDILWDLEKVPNLLPREITSQIDTWLSARAIQCAGKQSAAIVRGTKTKEHKRQFIINKLNNECKFKQARKLESINNKLKSSKPNINEVEPVLDCRFIKVVLDNETSFDGWVILGSLGNKMKIEIPFKAHKHFNKLKHNGTIKQTVQLSKRNITFLFELPEVEKRQSGAVIGIDIGQTDAISCSDGQQISKDNHGYSYETICKKLVKRKKGSKAFRRAETHRTNYINWVVNQINLDNVQTVRRENIKHLRKGTRTRRTLSHWNYAELFESLDMKLESLGVQVVKINPTYTSQRCFSCGWTRKSNRAGKQFKCKSCGHTDDADLNASKNISLDLPTISKVERLKQPNRAGFYWNVLNKELIVPCVQETILE